MRILTIRYKNRDAWYEAPFLAPFYLAPHSSSMNMNNIQCIIDIKTTFISIMVTGSLVTTARILAATSTLLRSVDLGGNCQSECSIDRSELLVFFFLSPEQIC